MLRGDSAMRLAISAAVAVGVLAAALLLGAAAPPGGVGHRPDAAIERSAATAPTTTGVAEFPGAFGAAGTGSEPWRATGLTTGPATAAWREGPALSSVARHEGGRAAASPSTADAAETPSAADVSDAASSARADARDGEPEPVGLHLPSQSLEAEVVPVAHDDDRRLEVPEAQLAGWYVHRSVPGDVGPAVIVGHVDGPDGPAVFFDLPEAEPGDPIEVVLDDDTTATFTVDRIEVHPKEAFPTEAVYGPVDEPELRLITCAGPFDPIERSYRDNVIVFAHLRD